MYLALNAEGERVPPENGTAAVCPGCRQPVIAKCGAVKVWHWAHEKSKNDCDPWGEGETRWHRDWQERAPVECCEVVMGEHRADIRRADGLVIELQHSWIDPADVVAREAFYGPMWWVFDVSPWKNFRVWRESGTTLRYRWMTRRETLRHVKQTLFFDLGGPLMKVERFGPYGIGSGSGTMIARSDFFAAAGLRALSEKESLGTSHYEIQAKDGKTPAVVASLHTASWAFSRGGESIITRHDLGGRTESTTVTCR